ncbi:MAG: hypothetical protein M1824_000009 [Vezdaea acicularis]|nr:MAG: hypothetical protein M1824_000009 [Vezdaea acicularis]
MGIFNVRSVVSWVYLLAHFLCLSEQASINLPVDPSSTKRVQKRGRDYAAQVRCIGLSPLLSPIDSPSAQQLCSKAEYAPALPEGAEVPLRANAYCGSDPSSQRDIFFDHVGTEATIPPLVFAFCATRCRCIALTPPNSAQWLAPEILNNLPAQQQSWDKNPDGIYTYPKANTINYTIVTEDDVHSWISAAPAMISRSYEPATFYSPPTCLDTLPSLLPYPFQPEDFSTAQQLCAAIWYGGKSTGNAGFVCSPLVPGSSILFLTQDTVLAQ